MTRVDDPTRLAALYDSGLLRPNGIPGIGRLLRIAKHALGTPTVMFSAVDADRQVFVGHIGLYEPWAENGETPLSHSYCQIVVTEDEPLIVTDAQGDTRVCDNPATVEASIGSYLGVPVRSPDGQPLGSFCALSDTPRQWTDDDVATLVDLAASVEVEVALRRTTDELSNQLVAEQLERSIETSMASIAAATSRSWTARDVLRALVDHGEEAAGAQLISGAVVHGGMLEYLHGEGVTNDVASNWVTGSIDDPVPMAHAVKTGETVVLPTVESFEPWPAFTEAVKDLGIQAFVALPVGDTIGGSRAVVALGYAEPLSTPTLPRSVARLGSLVRQSLDRAHSHQMAREHAELLEALVLPEQLPVPDGLDLAGSYLPPSAGQRVGGDLYEATVRPDGRVALIVADAAGHDLAASRATSRLRTALNMLTLESLRPAQILDYVNDYLQKSNVSTLITCVYVLIDTVENTATIANAGHPQPRLARTGGEVGAVGPLGQQLLGLGPCEYSEETVSFQTGETLTLFTDGLIERRSIPLREGEAWLEREIATQTGESAETIANHLLSGLGELEDDVAVLIVRHTGEASPTVDELERTIQATELRLSDVRTDVREWLSQHTRVEDIVLVTTELLTNARQASEPSDAEISLKIRRHDDNVDVIVTNQGDDFRHREQFMPSPENLGGRGLAIASALSDLDVRSDAPFVTVTARF